MHFDLRTSIGGKLWRGMTAAGFAGLLLAGCGDDSAERQKEAAEIAKGIEDQLALIEGPTQQPLRIRHDKVTVTPAEDGKSFAVAITGIRYGTEKEAAATFGELGYRLTPEGADQYLVGDLKMPKEIQLLKGSQSEGVIKLETTAFSATWSKPLQNFLKLDWQLKDLSATTAAEGEIFRIATAGIVVDGKESGKGLIDQVSKITMNAVAMNDPMGSTVKLDKLFGTVSAEKFDLPAYNRMIAKITELTVKYEPQVAVGTEAAPPPPPPAISEEDRKAIADVVRGFPKLISAYGYDFTAEGMTVTDAQGGVTMQLGQGGMAFGLKGIETDKAQANFSIRHDGLVLNEPVFQDPIAQAVLPKKGNLSLVATDIPVPSLVEGVAQALPQMTNPDPQVAQGGEIMMMGALMSALSQSSLKLRIEPSGIETEKAKLSADGELKLAMQSPQYAVGVVNLALLGLDDLIALAQSTAETNPNAMQAMGMLSMLQSLAQRETGADGKPVDKFKLDLTETGAVLVNGKPLDGIAP